MKAGFSIVKFRQLLVAGCFVMAMDFLMRASDNVIGGNVLGEDALAGLGLIAPLLSAVTFVASLVGTGTGVNCSMEFGRCNRSRAWQYFSQGLWTSLALGMMMGGVIWLGGEWFVTSFGAADRAAACSIGYCRWLPLVAMMRPVVTFLLYCAYTDGDTLVCMLSYGLQFLATATASALLVRTDLGTAGLAIGNAVGCLVAAGALSMHFVRKCNAIRLVRHFSLRDSIRIVATSFGDSSSYLCDAAFYYCLCKFMIAKFGQDVMPELGAVCTAFLFTELFIGIGMAFQPLTAVYFGERNYRAARGIFRHAATVAFVASSAMALALVSCPQLVVKLVGIASGQNYADAVAAVRRCAIGISFYTLNCMVTSYLITIEREGMSAVYTVCSWLLVPLGSVIAFSVFGENGSWLGYGLANVFSFAMLLAYVRVRFGRELFPLLLPRNRDAAMYVLDLEVEDRQISEISEMVCDILRRGDVDERLCIRGSMLTEEVLMAVKERNVGKRLIGEVTVDLNDGVGLTIRDDGEIFDITDADIRVTSLRTFLLSSLMKTETSRMNFVTTGFNRNVFSLKG